VQHVNHHETVDGFGNTFWDSVEFVASQHIQRRIVVPRRAKPLPGHTTAAFTLY
jgi:hypothetical protein